MKSLTPTELDKRLIRSRRALTVWHRKNDEESKAQIITEIGVLESLLIRAPDEKQAKIRALIEKYCR